ncbi:post-GPI attachment to proteins factor 2-like [Anopheles ziemanni]|uniref:post-GPI attachment to proteins factor 2-like n=1 Tax=Anopheles coustani TaxID=139045 RepID=UPI0026589DD6|nr:post-GPI attachment to proteins factor 2-like [Anopheles coustani]XP_058175641.1 post-GPI attachment to proteins factor 2-like [Anopheles ziemanni]
MAEDRTALDPTVDVSYKEGQIPLEKTDDIGPVMPPLHSTKQQQLQYDHDVAHLLQLIPGQPHLRQPIPTQQQQQPRLQPEPARELLKRKPRANEDGNSSRAVAADAHVHTKAAASDNEDEGGGGGTGDRGGPRKSPSEMLVVHLIIGFRDICVFTLVLPLGTLLVCFISAYVFQPEEIHETHCRVYNIIPSISAITGVSPQRYLWRVSIALHIGPRFVIAFVYRNWYRAMVDSISDPERARKACRMINVVYWLNLVEISALCGVTYISNKENYPLHEKVFIIFMTTSLSYMLATLKLLKILQPDGPQTPKEESSLRYKQAFFALSIASTIGLILFFLKHRFLCQDLAFSWFALCEYIVASANMGFHCTTMLDFPTEDFIIARNAKQYKKPHSSLGWKLD